MKVLLKGEGVRRSFRQLGDTAWWQGLARGSYSPSPSRARLLSLRDNPAGGKDAIVELTYADSRPGLGFAISLTALGVIAAVSAIAAGSWGVYEATKGIGSAVKPLVLVGGGAYVGKEAFRNPWVGAGIGAAIYYMTKEEG